MQNVAKPSENELIELLVFNKEDIENNKINFRWIHSGEFKYNGDMYDVVEKNETEKQLIIYCINDTKEKKLEEEFEKKVKDNLADKKQKSDNNPFQKLISEAVCYSLIISLNENKSNFGADFSVNYKSISKEIPSPPPKYS